MMKLVVDGKQKKVAANPTSVGQLLAALKISSQEALVKVNGKIRPEGTPISKKDRIEVIRVVFGG